MRRRVVIGPDARFLRLGGRPTRITAILLGVQLALFLLYVFADGPAWVLEYFACSASYTLDEGRLWQPLTAIWWHLEPRGLLIDLLALWVFGSPLERWWGRRRFSWFFLTTAVVGLMAGLAASLAQPAPTPLVGSLGAAVALLVAATVLFPRHMVHLQQILGITVRALTAVLGGFLLVGTLMLGAWIDLTIEVAGGLCALLFLYPPKQLLARWKLHRAKRKLTVVRGDSRGSGGYVN